MRRPRTRCGHLAVARGRAGLSPSNRSRRCSMVRGLGDDAEDRARQRGLAAAGFADHAQDMPARQVSSTWSRICARPSSVRTDRRRFVTSSSGRLGHRERLSRGSTMSRRPSPSRLKPSTVRRMASPGRSRTTRHPAGSARLSEMARPQSGLGRRGAHAEEAQHGRDQDREAHADGGAHDDGRDAVGQDVQEEDARRCRRRCTAAASMKSDEPTAAAPRRRRCG